MKHLNAVAVLLAGLLAGLQVNAASLIDFSDYASQATSITDTGIAASEYVLPLIVGVVALTVGIKLFKKFTGKI